jgi:thymidylate kinase
MAQFQRNSIWREATPFGAIGDLITVFKQAGPNRWRFAFLAMLPPLGIFWTFASEEVRIPPPKPKITYITSFRPDRTDAEIIASNIANQIYQDKLRAEQAKREEEVREIYKKLGRMSGLDVDAIEAKAKAERAAEEAAKKAQAPAARQ